MDGGSRGKRPEAIALLPIIVIVKTYQLEAACFTQYVPEPDVNRYSSQRWCHE
jgi:hypothetical protein